jgi:hypothetical protein
MFPYACSSTNFPQIEPQIVRSKGLSKVKRGQGVMGEWNGSMSGAKCLQDISTTLKLNQMLQPKCILILLQPFIHKLLSFWIFLLSHFIFFSLFS